MGGGILDLRQALEPWRALGKDGMASGTVRYIVVCKVGTHPLVRFRDIEALGSAEKSRSRDITSPRM